VDWLKKVLKTSKKLLTFGFRIAILSIVRMKQRNETMMNFETLYVTAPTLKSGWVATNASREVEIVLTTLDKFELWVGPRMMGKFDSFDEAKRNAEAIVPFTIKWED
tara:strand:- start:2145 stop:2465 length:321 start_codon:yes stop_codon:yes gene_type:complete